MLGDDVKRLKEIEHENTRLKSIVPHEPWTSELSKMWLKENSEPGTAPSGGQDDPINSGVLRALRV